MGVSPMLPTIKSLGISMLFLKVFGVLRTFLQKGSKPPEAVLLVPLQTAIYLALKISTIRSSAGITTTEFSSGMGI